MQTDLKNEIQQRYSIWSFDHSKLLICVQKQMLDLRRLGLDQIANEISHSYGHAGTT